MPVGCFNYGYKYYPEMENVTGQPFHLMSSVQCQTHCLNTPGCAVFAFWQESQECWLGNADAVLVSAPTLGAVSGPAACPQDNEACTTFPGPGFPGKTEPVSRAAWPTHHQPTTLQCWPRKSNGFPATCANKTVTVLEDTANGWPGRCKGLIQVSLQPRETCQSRCFNSPLCGVWALENRTTGVPTCWHGVVGQNCFDVSDGLDPMRAQMVMHGGFRVLMNTMEMNINNLTKIFDVITFQSWQDGAAACRKSCLSLLLCQYWQYSEVYGCSIEHSSVDTVKYPLVNNGIDMQTGTDVASTVRAGEYIQHICPKGQWTPLPLDQPTANGGSAAPAAWQPVPAQEGGQGRSPALSQKEDESFPMWGVLLIVLALALCASVIGAAVWMSMIDAERKSSRSKLIQGGMSAHSSGTYQHSESFASSHASGYPLMQQPGPPATQQAYGQQAHGGGGWGGDGSMWNQVQHHMHWPGAQQHYTDPRYAGVPTTTNMGPTQQDLMQYAGGGGGAAPGGGYPQGYGGYSH